MREESRIQYGSPHGWFDGTVEVDADLFAIDACETVMLHTRGTIALKTGVKSCASTSAKGDTRHRAKQTSEYASVQ